MVRCMKSGITIQLFTIQSFKVFTDSRLGMADAIMFRRLVLSRQEMHSIILDKLSKQTLNPMVNAGRRSEARRRHRHYKSD